MKVELIFCSKCGKLIELDDIIHVEAGEFIICNSCYVDKAFKEFDGIYPIESRWEILDL